MGNINSPVAFEDVRELLDRALATERGIRVRCKSRGAAVSLRARLNTYRAADRRANAKTYDFEHPMHSNSVYDRLQFRIPPQTAEDATYVYLEPRRAEALGEIEELGPFPAA